MLLSHNINVFNELEQALQESNCCCVVMGTGCGKTAYGYRWEYVE